MEHAIWKKDDLVLKNADSEVSGNKQVRGELLTAKVVSEKYATEKQIRIASANKELFCSDPFCPSPVLRYCHGEKKLAYFAHLDNCDCDYALFDQRQSAQFKELRAKLLCVFEAKGYSVRTEVKLLEHHYTHFLFEFSIGNLAVELGTQHLSARKLEALNEEYRSIRQPVHWVADDFDTKKRLREDRTFHIKRYGFHETKNRSLLVINRDGECVSQYKEDETDYFINGLRYEVLDSEKMYMEEATINQLAVERGELCIAGFFERYETWLATKQDAFRQKIERARRIREDEEQERAAELDRQMKLLELQAQKRAEEQKNRLGILEQRWITCEVCGVIDTDDKFAFYGGKNRANIGVCKECSRDQQRKEDR